MRPEQFARLLEADPPVPGGDWADDVLHQRPVPDPVAPRKLNPRAQSRREAKRKAAWEEHLMNDPQFTTCDISGIEGFDDVIWTYYPDDDSADGISVHEEVLDMEEAIGTAISELASDTIPRALYDQLEALKTQEPYVSGQFKNDYYDSHGDPYDPPDDWDDDD